MKLSDFDYILPEELIATKPLDDRDSSRLLVCDGKKNIDEKFTNIINFLRENDVLVLNNTKVIPAKLTGECRGTKVEINLIKKLKEQGEVWQVLAKPGKKMLVGENFIVAENFHAKIISKQESGEITLKFNLDGTVFYNRLDKHGKMPLPPYIEKKRQSDKSDVGRYQTVYADGKKSGSVAAPTAGLHLTEKLLEQIKQRGVEVVYVTLHVGAGTFFPIRVEDVKEHKMHSEYYEISAEAAQKINTCKGRGGRVIAVGTTSLRTLESAADDTGGIEGKSGDTDIFIYPGYRFKIVDALITNFHLPKSSLFLLVSAFMGIENIKSLYQHAINERYRFFSYGDASLLIRDKIVP